MKISLLVGASEELVIREAVTKTMMDTTSSSDSKIDRGQTCNDSLIELLTNSADFYGWHSSRVR